METVKNAKIEKVNFSLFCCNGVLLTSLVWVFVLRDILNSSFREEISIIALLFGACLLVSLFTLGFTFKKTSSRRNIYLGVYISLLGGIIFFYGKFLLFMFFLAIGGGDI